MIKMRVIAKHNDGEPVYGVTIPKNQAIFFSETYFNVERSGTSLILSSGAQHKITNEQINNFEFENGKV